MSTYEDASLIIPESPGYKVGKIYALKPIDASGDLTFSRNSVGYENLSNGNISQVAVNIPRYTFDLGSTCPNLLMEKQSTNKITYSRSITNGVYTKTGCTALDSVIVGRSGATDASTITATNTTPYIRIDPTASSTGEWIGGLYVKGFSDSIGKDAKIIIAGETATGTAVNSTVVLTGEWQLLQAVFTVTGTGTVAVQVEAPRSAVIGEVVGVTDVQFELGNYRTSTILTSSIEVTRLQDKASKTGVSSYINSAEGVLFAEISAKTINSSNRSISLSDSTDSNVVRFFYTNVDNAVQYKVTVGGVDVANSFTVLSNVLVMNKVALRWKENNFSLWVNGVKVLEDLIGSTFSASTLNRIGLDRGTDNDNFEGEAKSLMVFNSFLTDAKIATL